MVFTVKHHDSGIPTQPDNERPRNGGVSRASTSWSADYRVKVRLQTEEFASAKWRPTFCVSSAWRTLASFSRVVVAQRCVSLGRESKPHQATTGSRPESVCREETKLDWICRSRALSRRSQRHPLPYKAVKSAFFCPIIDCRRRRWIPSEHQPSGPSAATSPSQPSLLIALLFLFLSV